MKKIVLMLFCFVCLASVPIKALAIPTPIDSWGNLHFNTYDGLLMLNQGNNVVSIIQDFSPIWENFGFTDFNMGQITKNDQDGFVVGNLLGFDFAQYAYLSIPLIFSGNGTSGRMDIIGNPAYYTFDISGDIGNYVHLTNFQAGAAPVPEPATMLMFSTGLVGLVSASKMRKRKNLTLVAAA